MEENGNSLKERLLEYLKRKGIKKGEFCNSLGVSAAYISSMRVGISDDKKRIIKEKYPDLNMNWLVFGEGEMLITGVEHHREIPCVDCINCSNKDREIESLKAQIRILKEMILEIKK